jgi:hypothetical protein
MTGVACYRSAMRTTALVAVFLAIVGLACGSSSSGEPETPCVTAGGQCVEGGTLCAKLGPGGNSCNSANSAGGSFCCLMQ